MIHRAFLFSNNKEEHERMIITSDKLSPQVTSSGTINSYEDDEGDEFGDVEESSSSSLTVAAALAPNKREKRVQVVPACKRFKPNPQSPPQNAAKRASARANVEIPPIGGTNGLKVEPKVLCAKPPLPPKPTKLKMKRKIDENYSTNLNQKLAAQAEQLRLEVSQLKVALSTEKNAVRILR